MSAAPKKVAEKYAFSPEREHAAKAEIIQKGSRKRSRNTTIFIVQPYSKGPARRRSQTN